MQQKSKKFTQKQTLFRNANMEKLINPKTSAIFSVFQVIIYNIVCLISFERLIS